MCKTTIHILLKLVLRSKIRKVGRIYFCSLPDQQNAYIYYLAFILITYVEQNTRKLKVASKKYT